MIRQLVVFMLCPIAVPIAAAHECSEMINNRYDILSVAASIKDSSSFSDQFCTLAFKEEKAANKAGVKFNFPFRGLPVELGYQSGSQKWGTWYKNTCSEIKSSQTLQSTVLKHFEKINKDMIDGFNNCITADGLNVWLEPTDNPREFQFAARFITPTPKITSVKITKFIPTKNVTCDPTPTKIEIGPVKRASCTRSNDAAASIMVNANYYLNGAGRLNLPAIVHDKNP